MESIHKRIRALREKAGLTQEQLADKSGVKYQSVQEWERADGTAPSRKRQKAVADALGVTVHELMTGDRPAAASPAEEGLEAREQILLLLYRGLFAAQQERLIAGLRAAFEANQLVRKQLGNKPLRGVTDDEVRNAFGDAPFHLIKHGKKKSKRAAPGRDIGDAMGDFLE